MKDFELEGGGVSRHIVEGAKMIIFYNNVANIIDLVEDVLEVHENVKENKILHIFKNFFVDLLC